MSDMISYWKESQTKTPSGLSNNDFNFSFFLHFSPLGSVLRAYVHTCIRAYGYVLFVQLPNHFVYNNLNFAGM